MLATDVKGEARAFVGQTRLFVGTQTTGGLAAFSEVYTHVLSPLEQYRRALVDLNVGPSVTASGRRTTLRWPEIAFGLVALALGVGVLVLRRRSQDRDRSSRREG